MISRRQTLKAGGYLGASIALGKTAKANSVNSHPIDPELPNRLIELAVDSAVSNGASYSDVRMSHLETIPFRTEMMSIGVRALVDGYWGFAASPIWSEEEAVRLGRSAAIQARANVLGMEKIVHLAPLKPESGTWTTPIVDNPFETDWDEINDYIEGTVEFGRSLPHVATFYFVADFTRHRKNFGSSLGQKTSQLLYSCKAGISFRLWDRRNGNEASGFVDELSHVSGGIEYIRDRPLRKYIEIAHAEALDDLYLPYKPVEPGRFNVLIDQHGVGSLLSKSIGSATEIDRIFGYEQSSAGSSYINDPLSMLGTHKIGSLLLNIQCDRSNPISAGCVRWDDEGVKPVSYPLIKGGILSNLHTSREGVSWIKDHYLSSNQQSESFGCAASETATELPVVFRSDLKLLPSKESISRDDLRGEIDSGIEVRTPKIDMDFQLSSGWFQGRTYEIRNGKRISRILNAGMLFRTTELWNSLDTLGGESSVQYFGVSATKGQHQQNLVSGVESPPAIFSDATFIDITRKA